MAVLSIVTSRYCFNLNIPYYFRIVPRGLDQGLPLLNIKSESNLI